MTPIEYCRVVRVRRLRIASHSSLSHARCVARSQNRSSAFKSLDQADSRRYLGCMLTPSSSRVVLEWRCQFWAKHHRYLYANINDFQWISLHNGPGKGYFSTRICKRSTWNAPERAGSFGRVTMILRRCVLIIGVALQSLRLTVKYTFSIA